MANFLLVHGAWHDGRCWEAVRASLESRGHRTSAPDLAIDDPAADWDHHARIAVAALAGAEDAVVVAHSWAGRVLPLIATRAPVSLLVYLCARLAPSRSGEPSAYRADAFEGIEERPDGSRVVADPSHMYARVPREVATRAAAALRPQYWPDPPELDVRAHPRATSSAGKTSSRRSSGRAGPPGRRSASSPSSSREDTSRCWNSPKR